MLFVARVFCSILFFNRACTSYSTVLYCIMALDTNYNLTVSIIFSLPILLFVHVTVRT